MGRLRDCLTGWCSLPAAWVALALLLAMGAMLGSIQLLVGILMLFASPLLKRGFLAVVRHVYPTEFGRVHVWFMLFVRRHWLGNRHHARPIRVDFAAERGGPKWAGPPPGPPRFAVHVVAGLLDNYSYFVVEHRPTGPLRCAVVDPGDADAVLEALEELREQHYGFDVEGEPRGRGGGCPSVILTAILVTHKHWDHQAGVAKVLRRERPITAAARPYLAADAPPANPETLFSNPGTIAVVAGVGEPVRGATHAAPPGARFRLGAAIDVEVVPSPCHTKGHVMFAALAKDGESVDQCWNQSPVWDIFKPLYLAQI